MTITAQHALVQQLLDQALTEDKTQSPDAILRRGTMAGGFAAIVAALLAGLFLPLMGRK
jgi:hypothetical protein